MNQPLNRKERLSIHLTAFVLFLLYFIPLCIAALNRTLWGDEIHGINGAWKADSYWHLFWFGPHSEASPSPLHYMIDRFWSDLWNFQPQLFWNPQLFHRIPTITFTCLASLIVFYFLTNLLLRHKKDIHLAVTLVIAAGVSSFYYSNSMLQYFAIENRPYALWTLLGTAHMALLMQYFFDKQEVSRSYFVWYGLLAFLMVTTTFSALAQVCAGLLVQFLSGVDRRQKFWHQHTLSLVAVLLPALSIGFWHYTRIQPMNYNTDGHTAAYFIQSLAEVMAKTFHHHGAAALYITAPLFLFAVPLYYLRRSALVRWMTAYTWLLLLSGVVFFIGSKLKGGLFGAKYMIYLVPPLFFMYLTGLYTLADFLMDLYLKKVWPVLKLYVKEPQLSAQVRAFWPGKTTLSLFFVIVWSLVELTNRVPKLSHKIYDEGSVVVSFYAFGKSPLGTCPKHFGYNEQEVMRNVRLCRGNL